MKPLSDLFRIYTRTKQRRSRVCIVYYRLFSVLFCTFHEIAKQTIILFRKDTVVHREFYFQIIAASLTLNVSVTSMTSNEFYDGL